jgi:hypothetical protein
MFLVALYIGLLNLTMLCTCSNLYGMSINIKLSCGKSTGTRILEESYGDISTKSKSRQATNTVLSQEVFNQEYIYIYIQYICTYIYLRLELDSWPL